MESSMDIRERNVFWMAGLSILTFGIYALYWTYHLQKDTNRLLGFRSEPAPGTVVLLGIVTFGIYLVYWSWKQGIKFKLEAEGRGSNEARDCPSLYLVLQVLTYFVGITWVIVLALMQDRLNQLLRMRGQGERPYDPDRFNHTPEADIARRYRERAEAYEAEIADDEELQAALEGKRSLFLTKPGSSDPDEENYGDPTDQLP